MYSQWEQSITNIFIAIIIVTNADVVVIFIIFQDCSWMSIGLKWELDSQICGEDTWNVFANSEFAKPSLNYRAWNVNIKKIHDSTHLHYFLPQNTVINMVVVEAIHSLMVVSQQIPLHRHSPLFWSTMRISNPDHPGNKSSLVTPKIQKVDSDGLRI